jgi:2-polyprenyl-3-methyl-5-hydroxy-6-metoxy-1,4-benzoquinol methylase
MQDNIISSRDQTGSATLQVISAAHAFNDWMFETIAGDISDPVLEIGSGIGNISERILRHHQQVYLSDIDPSYCKHITERFGHLPSLKSVLMIDLVDPDFENSYRAYAGMFNSIVLLNVIEHIEDHDLAVRNASFLLCGGGRLIILAPAFRFLYCRFDRELGHYRRYRKKSMANLLEENGFSVVRSRYFNFVGIAGWLVMGKLLGKRQLDAGSMSIYEKLVPLNKLVDRFTSRFAGLSVLLTGVKK